MSTPSSTNPPDATPSDSGLPALERLRERIEAAAREIERLRSENAALSERVQELASHDVARTDGAGLPTLTLEGDPDELRQKVESFIEAIDQMLAEPGHAQNNEPTPESAG